MPAFEPVTKFNATVDSVERFPDMIRQAFRAATTGCPGPVHLQIKGNEGQLDLDEADMDPYVETQFAQVPPFRPYPDPAALKQVLDLLQAAERPIIVAGGGVRASGARQALVAFAEKLGIPVATSLNGKDSIPGNACALGRRGRHLFARQRQPGGHRSRSHLLHRQRDRRHDDAFLAGAAARHADHPDRSSSARISGATIR